MGASDNTLPPAPPPDASALIDQGYWFGVCRWLDLLDEEAVVGWAWALLEAGHDHDSIGALAGELTPQRDSIVEERLLPVLHDLGIAGPDSREDSMWLYLRLMVSELSQAETAQEVHDLLYRLFSLHGQWDAEETGLQDFHYLYQAVEACLGEGRTDAWPAVDCRIWEQEAKGVALEWLEFQSAPPLHARWTLQERERAQDSQSSVHGGIQWPRSFRRLMDWIKRL